MNDTNSDKDKNRLNLQEKSIQAEQNNDDQNVRPGQQPGKPASPKSNKPGTKSGEPERNSSSDEHGPGEVPPPDELKSPEKVRKEAHKISENEDFPVEEENDEEK